MTNTPRNKTVHSLKRGLDILMVTSKANRPIGITDLSRELGLAKGSIFRLVMTLVQKGFLTRDPATAKYQLGVKFWEIGHGVMTRLGIADVAGPVLEELSAATHETVHVTTLTEDGKMVFLQKLESTLEIRPNIQLGPPHPCYCTANGKAVLAFLEKAELQRILRGKRFRYTDSTIVRKDDLLAHLEGVRRAGYAVNHGEYRADLSGVAAPIFNDSGAVIGALGVSIPTLRVTSGLMRHLGALTVKGAREISSSLGWSH